MASADDGEHQQLPAERGRWPDEVARHGEVRLERDAEGGQLDDRIEGREPGSAVPAVARQEDPEEDRAETVMA